MKRNHYTVALTLLVYMTACASLCTAQQTRTPSRVINTRTAHGALVRPDSRPYVERDTTESTAADTSLRQDGIYENTDVPSQRVMSVAEDVSTDAARSAPMFVARNGYWAIGGISNCFHIPSSAPVYDAYGRAVATVHVQHTGYDVLIEEVPLGLGLHFMVLDGIAFGVVNQ